ncbi:MAG: thiamine phosphate synthase [Solirubrobacterales bacterium]
MSAEARRRLARLADARLYLVLDARPHGQSPAPLLEAALANGVDVVQLREKRLNDGAILESALEFREACTRHGALFVVNDRPDLAVRCEADGVHVGQADMAIKDVRSIVGTELLIGQSTHSPEDIDAARGADYIGVGPIWSTPSKPGRASVGLDLIEYAAAASVCPFFAIGGIDCGNVALVVKAGARRVAVIRAIRDAEDPAAATNEIAAALDGSRPRRGYAD